MVAQNSLVEIEMISVLFSKLLDDFCRLDPRSTKQYLRDKETLNKRIRSEGISFVTKTLPSLGKWLDRTLDGERFTPHPSFKAQRGRTTPEFLQALFNRLFSGSGLLVNEDAEAVKMLRQLLFLVYKLELPYSQKQEEAVISTFLANEQFLETLVLPDLSKEASLVSEILAGFDPREIVPRHGPGAVSTGERGDEKWVFTRKYSQIHQCYPYYRYFMVGGRDELLDRLSWYNGLMSSDKGVARVVLVPKDSRGPRLISCEPLEYQWIQQGLNRSLVRHLESHWLTRGQINFSDQSVNQKLAMESSIHHFYCTLDMKDASDLVSRDLVEALIPAEQFKFFDAVRSHSTKLPDGRIVQLRKYAPMGSAVCFSVEALVFWAICVVAVSRDTSCSLHNAARHVFVYGDDIIVPTGSYAAVVSALTAVGLTVNLQKCCSRGDFRESCGVDAYMGENVTPTRISTRWSASPNSGDCLASYASYANSLAMKGYHSVAGELRRRLESVHGRLPYGTDKSSYPCIHVLSASEACCENKAAGFRSRWSNNLQRVEFYVSALKSRVVQTELDSWPRLLRNLVSPPAEAPDKVAVPWSARKVRCWRAIW